MRIKEQMQVADYILSRLELADPSNICQAWYKARKFRWTHEFALGVEHRALCRTGELYSDEHKYVQKIRERFSFLALWSYFPNKEAFMNHILKKHSREACLKINKKISDNLGGKGYEVHY